MGIYEKPAPALLDRLEKVFGFAVPREHGYDTVGAIEAMRNGAGRVFFAMGGNFAAATPDTAATWRIISIICRPRPAGTAFFSGAQLQHGFAVRLCKICKRQRGKLSRLGETFPGLSRRHPAANGEKQRLIVLPSAVVMHSKLYTSRTNNLI